jgi:hypothetical protein
MKHQVASLLPSTGQTEYPQVSLLLAPQRGKQQRPGRSTPHKERYLWMRWRQLGHADVLRRRIPVVNVTIRSASGLSLSGGATVKMNPPCPRRTCLTRTASWASGSTMTSPASTSPARIMASTDEHTTVQKDRFHPGRECGMSGRWTAGNAPADRRHVSGQVRTDAAALLADARDGRLAWASSIG